MWSDFRTNSRKRSTWLPQIQMSIMPLKPLRTQLCNRSRTSSRTAFAWAFPNNIASCRLCQIMVWMPTMPDSICLPDHVVSIDSPQFQKPVATPKLILPVATNNQLPVVTSYHTQTQPVPKPMLAADKRKILLLMTHHTIMTSKTSQAMMILL